MTPDLPPSEAPRRASASPSSPGPAILLAGFTREEAAALERHLDTAAEIRTVGDGPDEIREHLRDAPVAVLCLGTGLAGARARELLERLAPTRDPADPSREISAAEPPAVVILAAGPRLELFQEAIDRDRIHFLCCQPPEATDQAALVESALRAWAAGSSQPSVGPGTRLRTSGVDEILDRLPLQTESGDAAALLAEAALEALNASRAWCLLHDPLDDTLWAPNPNDGGERRDSAAVGLVSFVVRCGRPVRVPRVDADPRYDREADAPGGDGTERLLAVPLHRPLAAVGRPVPERTLGVLVALREEDDPPFEPEDADVLTLLARHGSAFLERLLGSAPRSRGGPEAAGSTRSLFRNEAVESWTRPDDGHGDPLRISPAWIRWGFRFLVAGLLAVLAFLGFAETDRHVTGEAFVRNPSSDPGLVILLPGHALPRLEVGMEGRFQLHGFSGVDQPITVRAVRRELTSRADALDGLPAAKSATGAGGPLAVVEARLPSSTFEADGHRYSYAAGMRGTAEVRIGRERLLFALLPGLRALGGGDHG